MLTGTKVAPNIFKKDPTIMEKNEKCYGYLAHGWPIFFNY